MTSSPLSARFSLVVLAQLAQLAQLAVGWVGRSVRPKAGTKAYYLPSATPLTGFLPFYPFCLWDDDDEMMNEDVWWTSDMPYGLLCCNTVPILPLILIILLLTLLLIPLLIPTATATATATTNCHCHCQCHSLRVASPPFVPCGFRIIDGFDGCWVSLTTYLPCERRRR